MSSYYFLGVLIFNNVTFKKLAKGNPFEGIAGLRILGSLLTGLAFSIILIGLLFKIMRWLGGGLYLLAGVSICGLSLLVSIIRYLQKKDVFYVGVGVRILLIVGLGLIMMLISSSQLVELEYRNHPSYIEAYKESLKYPNDEQVQQRLEHEFQKTFLSPEEAKRYDEHLNREPINVDSLIEVINQEQQLE